MSVADHAHEVTTYATTLLDGTDLFTATLVCECGYQAATDTEYLTAAEAALAVRRIARWSEAHAGVTL